MIPTSELECIELLSILDRTVCDLKDAMSNVSEMDCWEYNKEAANVIRKLCTIQSSAIQNAIAGLQGMQAKKTMSAENISAVIKVIENAPTR